MKSRLAFATCAVCITQAANAVVHENLQYKPYAVTGATEAEVRANIRDKQPSKGFDGYTRWHVNWRYAHASTASGCAVSDIHVRLDIAIIMPKLESGKAALRESFETYIKALTEHELGHAETGRMVARNIDARLASLTAPTCEALDRTARELAHAITREGNAQDIAYDVRTGHGETQGARWPLPPPPEPPMVTTAPAE